MWHYLFFYWTLELFRQCGIICYSTGLWNCSDSVVFLVCLCDFGTVPTIWHYLFFYVTLELLDNMALFVFLCDFGTVPTIWHYLFLYWTLELFRQCGIICFSMEFGTFPRVWHYWFFIFILDFGTDSISIIWFSMGLWKYSHSVAISVYLLNFGTDQTECHYLFFYCTLKQF